ncbi:hypothetical protein [Kribbella caucasensis]|nr:hypothetical protein [Kribbella sp. VKM Ac-2527]
MTGMHPGLASGLPDDVQRLLGAPPVTEKMLLELSVGWADLPPDQARLAEVVRLFVITWDPLESIAPRPDGFATVNLDPLEIAIYVPSWSLLELATKWDDTFAAVLARVAGSAVVTAATHPEPVLSGDYPGLTTAGVPPDLLSDTSAGAALGPADIRLVSPGWQDIGLGAITDAVQHSFGSVDLDRSPVELAAASASRPGCPACTGRRFGFPADLSEARDRMCTTHRREAESVINRRLARANASNPDGWGALIDATVRREHPHLPNGLATKLTGSDDSMYVRSEPAELAQRAELVIQAASWFPGRRDDLAIALGQDPDLAGRLPEWLVNLILDLGHAGLGAEAAHVGDALAQVDPESQAIYDADVAVALAEAGLAKQARDRIAANLTRWPDDFWVRVHAGDALAALGDLDEAEAHLQTAVEIADAADDFERLGEAISRLRQLSRRRRPSEGERANEQRRRQPRKQSRSQRKRRR